LLLRVAAVRYPEDKQYQSWLAEMEKSAGDNIDSLMY
jgi:hypothetical protein